MVDFTNEELKQSGKEWCPLIESVTRANQNLMIGMDPLLSKLPESMIDRSAIIPCVRGDVRILCEDGVIYDLENLSMSHDVYGVEALRNLEERRNN